MTSSLLEAEVRDQGGHVVGHRLEGHGTVHISGVAVGSRCTAMTCRLSASSGRFAPNISLAPTRREAGSRALLLHESRGRVRGRLPRRGQAFGVVVHFAFSFSDRSAWARPRFSSPQPLAAASFVTSSNTQNSRPHCRTSTRTHESRSAYGRSRSRLDAGSARGCGSATLGS